MKRRVALTSLTILLIAAGGWSWVNPAREFGISQFGVTTYSRVPVPYFDMQVRADGVFRPVLKSHRLDAQQLAWVLAGQSPRVLVLGTGWEGGARVAPGLRVPEGTQLLVLPTPEALAAFNQFRSEGISVAIHVHSTC